MTTKNKYNAVILTPSAVILTSSLENKVRIMNVSGITTGNKNETVSNWTLIWRQGDKGGSVVA